MSQAQRIDGSPARYDMGLIVLAGALAAFGLIMVASSSIAISVGGPFVFAIKHGVFLALGLALGYVVARTELEWFERHAFVLLLLSIALLLAVFVPGLGIRLNGARRWIRLGISTFQSVEAVKLMFVVYLASYLVRHQEAVQTRLFGVIKPVGVAGVLIALLLAQPDFGSSALIVAVTVGMVWLGGARMRYLLYLAVPLLPLIVYVASSSDYRVKRLTSFLNPWAHPFDDGFQLTQALIAIGRGEWFGVGLGGSVQKLSYLPEANSDFILAVVAEEFGFVGIMTLLAVFGLLVCRGLLLGYRAVQLRQRFAGYCAFGISLSLGLQALVSVGVNMGVLPTKGLTLPLISYGGSSVMMTCAMIGLLLRVSYEVSRAEAAREDGLVEPREFLGATA